MKLFRILLKILVAISPVAVFIGGYTIGHSDRPPQQGSALSVIEAQMCMRASDGNGVAVANDLKALYHIGLFTVITHRPPATFDEESQYDSRLNKDLAKMCPKRHLSFNGGTAITV